MRSIIYYFSGRGNSYSLAKALSERLDDAAICFMEKSGAHGIDSTVDCLGIVAPVIDFGIPAHVKEFIKTLKAEGRQPYVFSVVTCGGLPCASMLQLKRRISRAGLKPGAGFVVKFGLEGYSEADWNSLLDNMCSVIKSKTVLPTGKTSLRDKFLTSLLNPLARLLIPTEDKKFKVRGECNGCGVYARVCLAGNIKIADKKPVWRHKCEQCAACFAWCPKEAVYGTNLAARTRYRNTHVTLNQILKG